MPIQQKLPLPVLLFSDFAGWDDTKQIKITKFSPKITDNCTEKEKDLAKSS